MSSHFSQISFLKSAPSLAQSPIDVGSEVAFVGRSNAGKSTAINCITGKSKLARTSKTPGRTQLINFFQIDESKRLVDLPGLGYAKVPTKIQKQIESLLNQYLSFRTCLKGLILLMDIRHPLTNIDMQLINFANQRKLPVHILLTKADKLKRGPGQEALLQTKKELKNYPYISVQTFSALSNVGIEEATNCICDWLMLPHFSLDEKVKV